MRTESDAERRMRELTEELGRVRAEEVDLDVIEQRVQEAANAWGREQMAMAMKRADCAAPEVEIGGERWGNRRRQESEYQTIFGPVTIDRSIYQQSGRGRVAVPMELRLGIIEGAYTPKLARIATRALAGMPEQEAAALLREVGTATLSAPTLGRVSRAMAARYEQRRGELSAAVRERDPIPMRASTVQVSLDGVMVPQDGELAQPRGRKADEPEPPRYEHRYGVVGVPGPRADDRMTGRAWHEAAVGTIAFFDDAGERLKTIYLARMPEPYKATLIGDLEAELQCVLRERPDLNIVFASDGDRLQWQALDGIESRLSSKCTGHRMKLVDAFHVAEYIREAAEALWGETGQAKVHAATWRETIKHKRDGSGEVLRSLRARLRGARHATARRDLQRAIDYIARQRELGRTDYVEAQRRQYPIGTGITEAAAKTIVGTRMKRAGARFSQHGGQTIMLFRSAMLSDRFAALHAELHQTYRSPVKAAA